MTLLAGYLKSLFLGRKFRRALLWSLTLGLSVLLVSAIAAVSVFDNQHNHIVYHYVQRQDDIAILSTTHYVKSKSFAPNSIVLLFVAHQVFHYKHSTLKIISSNSSGNFAVNLRIMPVIGQMPFYCKWVPFIAVGQIGAGTRRTYLVSDEGIAELALRQPYKEEHNVVACFSPLFLNERWQLLILTAQIYSHYGAFMHFYIRSMMSDLVALLKYYKNARVRPWAGIQLGNITANGADFKPDFELEFRNQAGAMTDCLLMYKESAKFVVFPDADDVIIPRAGANYYAEFSQHFALFPEAAAIAYNATQTKVHSTSLPSEYSITEIMTSITFKGESLWGKLVVMPERIDSIWIHRSYGIRDGYEQVALPIELNSILHLRFWNFSKEISSKARRIPLYNPFNDAISSHHFRRLFEAKDLAEIEMEFGVMKRKMNDIYVRLPQFSLYYPLIDKCYNEIFYNGQSHATCKGPEMCKLPRFSGVRCTNVVSSVETLSGQNIFVHVQKDVRFQESSDGCAA